MSQQYLDGKGVLDLWNKVCENDNKLKENIENIEQIIEILNGDESVAGSVKNVVLTEIAEKIQSSKIEELKNLLDSISTSGTGDLVSTIAQVNINKNEIEKVQNIVEEMPDGLKENISDIEKDITNIQTNLNLLKILIEELNPEEIEGTDLKEKIKNEMDNQFQIIDVDSLNLTWN